MSSNASGCDCRTDFTSGLLHRFPAEVDVAGIAESRPGDDFRKSRSAAQPDTPPEPSDRAANRTEEAADGEKSKMLRRTFRGSKCIASRAIVDGGESNGYRQREGRAPSEGSVLFHGS